MGLISDSVDLDYQRSEWWHSQRCRQKINRMSISSWDRFVIRGSSDIHAYLWFYLATFSNRLPSSAQERNPKSHPTARRTAGDDATDVARIPENTGSSSNVGVMLDHRRSRWSNITPAFVQLLVFAKAAIIWAIIKVNEGLVLALLQGGRALRHGDLSDSTFEDALMLWRSPGNKRHLHYVGLMLDRVWDVGTKLPQLSVSGSCFLQSFAILHSKTKQTLERHL